MSYLKAQPSVENLRIVKNHPFTATGHIILNGAMRLGDPFTLRETHHKRRKYDVTWKGHSMILRDYLYKEIKTVMMNAVLEQAKVSSKRAYHLSAALIDMNV